ncbi:MAG TPA: choice-of-anchor B family protein [Bacteroidia bacterium]|nr:choice-of-anchor B family protein [Bacteroidia bacterium]
MKRIILVFGILFCSQVFAQNLALQANLSYGNSALANIGGYVDSLGNEYALVGTDFGLSIVDVTVPANPVIRFTVNDASSEWREVKTYRTYAYVTTEGGGGLTIIDLSLLPATITTKHYTGDGAIAGQLNSIHALHCDTTKGFLYLYGSNIGDGNTLFLDLSDPWNPVYAGEYSFPGGGQPAYVHDGYADNDTLYEAHIYAGFFAVVDVRNKSNPVLITTQSTPTTFTHNTWLSADHHTLFTTDENSNSFLAAYDISDLSNIEEISRFQTASGSGAIVHNTHILNDYAITSWYKEGVVITDVSRPGNPIEVGHYDTYPQGSGNGFSGCWGVYPFLPSGTIVASDINNGLFVLSPTYVRGCYLEGNITDLNTGIAIPGARTEILGAGVIRNSNSTGLYQTGMPVPGTVDALFSKPGYYPKTITGIVLSTGVVTQQDVQLEPLPSYEIIGTISDLSTGTPVQGATVSLSNSDFNFTATTNSQGGFTFTGIIDGTYDIKAGEWGYVTQCSSLVVTGAVSQSFQLERGYYDDFTFDYGWTVSGTTLNAWERGEPYGTFSNTGDPVNPEFDVTTDCSDQCFVTDNDAGNYSANDVDNGYTILTSPVFDATIYLDPQLEYYRWFSNFGGSSTPNDSMVVRLFNGSTTVTIENIDNTNGSAQWTQSSFLISPFITPTQTMQFIVEIADNSPGHIVEGAIDAFRITGALNTSTATLSGKTESNALTAFPNPFYSETSIHYQIADFSPGSKLVLWNTLGQVVESFTMQSGSGVIKAGSKLIPGIYFLGLVQNGRVSERTRIVRQ